MDYSQSFYHGIVYACLRAIHKDELLNNFVVYNPEEIYNFLNANPEISLCHCANLDATLNDSQKGLPAILSKLDAIVNNSEHGLAAINQNVDGVKSLINDPNEGLGVAISSLDNITSALNDSGSGLDALSDSVTGIANSLATIGPDVESIKTEVLSTDHGLSVIKNIDSEVDTLLKAEDKGIVAIANDVGNIKTAISSDTYGLSKLAALCSAIDQYLKSATEGLPKSIADIDNTCKKVELVLETVKAGNKVTGELKNSVSSYNETIAAEFATRVTSIYAAFQEQIQGWNVKIEQNILKWTNKSEEAEALRLSLSQVLDQLNERVSALRSSLSILGDINVSASKYATWVASASAMSELLGELTAAVGQMRDNVQCIMEVHKSLVKTSDTANIINAVNTAANLAAAGGKISEAATQASRLKMDKEDKW